jgi:2-polyprenyl-3-methyl-5-hydroxy-6-metoxy-1,4-benzoquinol methylase
MENKGKIFCDVCNNSVFNRFTVLYDKKDYKVVTCDICDFAFIPQYARIDIEYETYRDEQVLEEVRKGNNWLKFKRHKLRVKFIKRLKKTGKIFDIGTGWGHFLHTAAKCGYDASGVEISELMHHYAVNDLKLIVRQGDFFVKKLPEKYYDVATMWDVLEHLDNPSAALKRANLLLKTGGFLVLQVPQMDSFIAKWQKEDWSMMSPEHLNYFSKKTIKKMLEKNGFELVKIKSSFEFKLFIMFRLHSIMSVLKKKKNASEFTSNSERQGFYNRLTSVPHFILVIMMFFHDIIYQLFSFFKIGDEMIVAARKIS